MCFECVLSVVCMCGVCVFLCVSCVFVCFVCVLCVFACVLCVRVVCVLCED